MKHVFVVVALALTIPSSSRAQVVNLPAGTDTAALRKAAELRLGRSVSQADVINGLRQSGMSRSEARVRLERAGYDPSLVDRYFDVIEKGADPPTGSVPEESLLALSRIGVRSTGTSRTARDTTLFSDADGMVVASDSSARGLEVFGLRVFRSTSTQFEPVNFGPVDSSYRLGPGDELTLILTGDVEAAYPLAVTRDGQLFVPSVGQIAVNNLTLAELREVLASRLGRVYSGISQTGDGSTRFQLSLGQLRTNQVFITGDVAAPGSYQVSSVGGLFNALYQAGGPTAMGSFRQVQVWRGGRLFHTADLYDFLVSGDGSSDVRLEHNDRIFVPPAGVQVHVLGSVRRPAIYEVKPNETVRTVLSFAGGMSADALARHVQIDRILPPSQQTPGRYRTIIDVDLADLNARLADGDVLRVFSVTDDRRNRILLTGEVRMPGVYEWNEGITLWSAIARADGLGETAYTPRAHVYRVNDTDGSQRLIQVSLERDEAGRPLHDLQLADRDSIVIFSRAELRNEEFVAIDGLVKRPGTYALATGMSLKDLVLAAQGFLQGAATAEAEVSRMPDVGERTLRTALVYRVPLTLSGDTSRVPAGAGNNAQLVPSWTPLANEFQLLDGDHVFIRRAPGYEQTRLVTIIGEVTAPGMYALETRTERLNDLLMRAKDLTAEAYPPGIHVIRQGRIVAADLERGIQHPTDANNIVLEEGDSIVVPALNQTVTITGEVVFEAMALYRAGEDLAYYLEQAGGVTRQADKHRITVTYPNGERRVAKRSVLGMGGVRVEPGSTIFVPAKPEGRSVDWGTIFTRATAVIGTVATLVIAFR